MLKASSIRKHASGLPLRPVVHRYVSKLSESILNDPKTTDGPNVDVSVGMDLDQDHIQGSLEFVDNK